METATRPAPPTGKAAGVSIAHPLIDHRPVSADGVLMGQPAEPNLGDEPGDRLRYFPRPDLLCTGA